MYPASACGACGAWRHIGPAKASGPGPLKDQDRLSAASARSRLDPYAVRLTPVSFAKRWMAFLANLKEISSPVV